MPELSTKTLSTIPAATRLGVRRLSVSPGESAATTAEVAAEVSRSLERLERGEYELVDLDTLE